MTPAAGHRVWLVLDIITIVVILAGVVLSVVLLANGRSVVASILVLLLETPLLVGSTWLLARDLRRSP